MSEGNGAMRFSYCMLPDYPLGDSIDMIRTADELGGGYEVMRTLKRALDPNNVMNPGKYGLDGAFEEDLK